MLAERHKKSMKRFNPVNLDLSECSYCGKHILRVRVSLKDKDSSKRWLLKNDGETVTVRDLHAFDSAEVSGPHFENKSLHNIYSIWSEL